jgi:hypothetical protein
MPKSIKQLQDELLSSGLLDRLASSRTNFAELNQLPILEQYIILAASNFILRVKQNIEVLGINDTGNLSDDISQGELVKQGDSYSITVGYPANSPASKYYDFVNKGVKGFKSGTPNSPYSFKNLRVSRRMVSNIKSWVDRNAIRSNEVAVTRRQALRQSLSNMVSQSTRRKSLAYAVAVGIKKKGLRKTGFFDNAIDSYFGNDFTSGIAKVIGQDIKVIIRQNGNNNQ